MPNLSLIFGAGRIDRIVSNADRYLFDYRNDIGYRYQNYHPITPADSILPEDLAVTLLMNSQVGWRAFQTLQDYGTTIDLVTLPTKSLEDTTSDERRQVAIVITQLAQLPGFASSVATKLLHKKRPTLIPVLDNQAIYGAYMNPKWPQQPARTDSIKSLDLIDKALEWIAFDLNRLENISAWTALQEIEPNHSRIQIFDSVWWMYFRGQQPVHPAN